MLSPPWFGKAVACVEIHDVKIQMRVAEWLGSDAD